MDVVEGVPRRLEASVVVTLSVISYLVVVLNLSDSKIVFL